MAERIADVPAPTGNGREHAPWPTRMSRRSVVASIVIAAFVVRFAIVLRHGGLNGTFGYDSGVYFAGADAFVHGRLPYRDFVLLHPPLLMVTLAPFAALTWLMSDGAAFSVAVVSWCGLGALNAGLVVLVCRRLGLRERAAVVGGCFYALWFGTIGAEYLIKLETLGNTLLLASVLALLRARNSDRLAPTMMAGALVGAFATTKLWCVVPALMLLWWHARQVPSQRLRLTVVASAVTAVVD